MNEFGEAILRHCKIDNSFLIIADDGRFPEIETGIIFILATWSFPSLQQFSLLTETLSKFDFDKFKIYVLDTDKLNQDELNQKKISTPQGWGETYWIKNYKIEHFLSQKDNDISQIVEFTKELFAE